MSEAFRVRLLGTGTSTGVPIPCCSCEVCTSLNPRNSRLRTSIFLEFLDSQQRLQLGVLVDTAPDLRQQALRYKIPRVDAVAITHTHADHIFGMDDLRGFNFAQKTSIPVYASKESASTLASFFSYCFYPDPSYQGGAPPSLELKEIDPLQSFSIHGRTITPVPVLHGSAEVLGFRIGPFAYLTDCSEIPESSLTLLEGVRTIVLDGLRYRPHPTHFSLDQAIEVSRQLQVEESYLTHLSHEVEYDSGQEYVQKHSAGQVHLAYDGLLLDFTAAPKRAE